MKVDPTRKIIKIGNRRIIKTIKPESEETKHERKISEIKKDLGMTKSRPMLDVDFCSYQTGGETVVIEKPKVEVIVGPRGQQYCYVVQGTPKAVTKEDLTKDLQEEDTMQKFAEEFKKEYDSK